MRISLRAVALVITFVLAVMPMAVAGRNFSASSSSLTEEMRQYVPLIKKIEAEARAGLVQPQMRPKDGIALLGPSKVFEEIAKFRDRREIALESLRDKDQWERVRMQAAAAGLIPARSAAPSFSRNLLLSRDYGTPIQTEPYVCSNPEDRNNVVVTVTDYGLPYNSVYASFDGGETWRGPERVPLTGETYFSGDPVVACGRNKKSNHVFMSIGNWDYTMMRMPLSLTRTDIAVSVSADGGLTWKQPSIVATNRPRDAIWRIPTKDQKTGKDAVLEISLHWTAGRHGNRTFLLAESSTTRRKWAIG